MLCQVSTEQRLPINRYSFAISTVSGPLVSLDSEPYVKAGYLAACLERSGSEISIWKQNTVVHSRDYVVSSSFFCTSHERAEANRICCCFFFFLFFQISDLSLYEIRIAEGQVLSLHYMDL